MLKRLTNITTWSSGIAGGAFVQWGAAAGVAFFIGLTGFADSYTLSNSGTTSYQHVVQNGGGVTEISNTYTVEVPAGMAAKVTLQESGNGFVWQNCETSTFRQMVNGSYQTLQNRTTEFLSTATISLSMTCSPAVSWTETPIIGYLSNGMPRYGHYIYHYYTYYYAKMNYRISVSYESLLPDLVVSSVSLSSTDAAVDETVTMTYTVRNAGRKNVTATTVVRIYDGDTQICGDQTVPALSVGATSTMTVTLPKLSAGKHTLKVVVDALNAIEESYEGNNESTVSLRDYTRTPVDVTFDTDGGSESRSRTVIAGDKVGSLPVPFRKGYDFAGWWTERTGGYQIDANEKVTMARTFYAHWTAKTSTITLNLQGGNGSSTVQATFDEILPMVPVPVREGHTFGGYWTGVNGTGTQYYSADGRGFRKWDFEIPEAVLYAKWTGVAGAVELDVQEGAGGSRSVTATFESAMPDIVLPTRSGWTFQGYYSAPNGEGVQYYTASGVSARIWDQINESAVMLYAYWLPNKMTYSLVLDRQNGDGGSASVTATYAADMPKIDVPTRAQYVFEGYFSEPNGGGTQYYSSNGDSIKKWDITPDNGRLYANWSKAFRVRMEPNGAGGSATYDYFTEQVWHLAANPYVRSGYVFAGWAFEPDVVPTLADGAKVSKSLLGYGDDPNAEPVTLYAIWGKPLETSVFPGIKFVTGGVGTNPYWFEEDGALRSAVSASNSWLCATFENRGELQQIFEDTLYRQGSANHNVERCDFNWMSGDKVYTNECVGVSCRTNDIPSGRQLVTWICRKTFALSDWGGLAPTDDPEAFRELYVQKTNELEIATQRLCMEYNGYIGRYDIVSNVVRGALATYKLHIGMGVFHDYVLSRFSSKYGYSISGLRTDSAIRSFNNIISPTLHLVDDVATLEYGFAGYGVLRQLLWKEKRLVGFVVKEDGRYEEACAAQSQIFDLEVLSKTVESTLCGKYVNLLRPYKTNWSDYDTSRVRACVKEAFDSYRSGLEGMGGLYNYIMGRLADREGYNVSPLRPQNATSRLAWAFIQELYDLIDQFTKAVDEIHSLERRIADCGVLQWKSVLQGDAIGSLPIPQAEDGYEFAGWWTASDEGVRVTEKTTVDADVIVYAHWTKKSYTLSFVTGTSESFAQRTLGYDEPLGKLPTPMREGYTFGGWTYSEGGKTATMLDVLTADATLQAQWTKNTDWQEADKSEESGWMISVTFDANGGTSDITSCGRNSGDRVGTLPISVRTGYQFDGWFTGKTGGERIAATTVVRVDATYYAHWTANTYTIRFMSNGGAGTMEDQKATYDSSLTLLVNAFKREGMRFGGWATSAQGGVVYKNRASVKNLTAEPNAVVVLYAVWVEGQGVESFAWGDDPIDCSAANTYDGFLWKEDALVGLVQVKTAKQTVKKTTDRVTKAVTVTTNITATATVTDANGKKWSYSKRMVTVDGVVSRLKCTTKDCPVPEFGVALGKNGLEGEWGAYEIHGARNGMGTKDDEMMEWLGDYKGKWSVTIAAARPEVAPYQAGESSTLRLQLNVQAKGVVKITGSWESGEKVSASAQMVMGDGFAYVPVMVKATKTTPALTALFRIEGEMVELVSGRAVDPSGVSRLMSLVGGGRTVEELGEPVYLPSEVSQGGAPFLARVAVDELAYPAKFAAKGLPAGLKINAATGVISGTPTKPGSYTATVTVTSGANSSVKKTVSVPFTIENYVDPKIRIEDAYGPYYVGVSMNTNIVEAADTKASGLPSGLKWSTKTLTDKNIGAVPAWSVYGVPTKACTNTVYFKKSVKETVDGKQKTVTHQASATFRVEGMRPWAVGTFNGGNTNGMVTLTVSNVGKISGKWMSGGTNWTLSAVSFDAYISSEQMYVATVIGKSGKLAMTNEIEVTESGIAGYVTSGKDSACPFWEAWRNGWKEDPLKALAKKLKGQKRQVGEVLLTVGASGAVTAKGTFVTGFDEKRQKYISYSASCSTALIPTMEAGLYRVYLYFPPKSGKFDGFSDVVEIVLDVNQ